MAKKRDNSNVTVMVSSSVYGQEELLDRIYGILSNFGFEVWMSHKGTVPTNSNENTLESCLRAVQNCDFFLGIISPHYGSSINNGLSITHLEFQEAIRLKKPRWFLVHDRVVFARQLLRYLGYENSEQRSALTLKKNSIFTDLKLIDMYEEANEMVKIENNTFVKWVQSYDRDEDAIRFATAQFSRYQDLEELLKQQLNTIKKAVEQSIAKGTLIRWRLLLLF